MAEYDEKDIASNIMNRSKREYIIPRADEIVIDVAPTEQQDVVLTNEEQTTLDAKNAAFQAAVKNTKAKPLPSSRMDRRVNVTRTINELGFNPVTTLVHIATNNWRELGIDKPVSAHEINSAAQTILGYTAPGIKPVDFVDPDKQITQIPTYVPKRGLLTGPNETPILTDEDFLEDIPTIGDKHNEG